MGRDVRRYFNGYASNHEKRARQVGTQLARGGVEDMDTLCDLLISEPESLLKIRNIGKKSMDVIRSACEMYLGERNNISI